MWTMLKYGLNFADYTSTHFILHLSEQILQVFQLCGYSLSNNNPVVVW